MSVVTQQPVEVSASGELVILCIGNMSFSIEFPLALQLAVAIRYHARLAKLNSGRDERGFHVVGVLHDASAQQPKRKRFIERLPELLRPRGLNVDTDGQLVVVTFGRTTLKLPYPAARTLAQWMRVRGKEAKLNAGEHRHWSEIARQVPSLINGSAA